MIHLRGSMPVDQLERVRTQIENGRFERSGTAGGEHLELVVAGDAAQSPGRILLAALEANDEFQAAAWPSAIALPRVCRYEAGMGDEDHHDPAFFGGSPPMRCDLAGIVSISDTGDCRGGDLVFDSDGVPQKWKGRAGDCLLYAPGPLRRIDTVQEGVLLVAHFSVHSAVADPVERRILFDLTRVLERLELDAPGDPLLETFRHGFFDLVRMWTSYPSRRRGSPLSAQ